MITINGIPVYAANVFDAETGIFKVAICDNPAIQSGFQAFGEEKQVLKYSVQDEEQRIVLGCLMRSSYPIYRRNADGFEYFIVYTSDTIEQMASKWLASQNVNNINLNHQEGTDQDGIYLMQAFIKNTDKGISPTGFEDIEDGSLFAQYKIMNEDVWAAIKEGTYVGFSLEGMFGVEPMEEEFSKQETNNNKEINKKFMSKLSKIKEALKSLLVQFGTVATDKGTIVWDGDDELEAGMAVNGIDEEGNEIPLEDGVYITEDKKQITVAEGKVVSIDDVDAEVAPTEEPSEEPKEEENADEEPMEEPTEEPKEDEGEDKDAIIEELKARIAELEKENEELKAKLEESAAPSAEEAFEKLEVEDDTPTGKLRKRGYVIP